MTITAIIIRVFPNLDLMRWQLGKRGKGKKWEQKAVVQVNTQEVLCYHLIYWHG
jgi:hypothetical protein